MKKLSLSAFRRARDFLHGAARPLERELFAHEFEGGPAESALRALDAFRNPDGGYGHGLEPDLRMPGSSVLGTLSALDLMRELGCDAREPRVRGAIGWLVGRFDPALPGWRYVGPEAEDSPHAPHWKWQLHQPGGPWDHVLNPGGRGLALLSHWPGLAPPGLRETLERAFVARVTQAVARPAELGVDTLFYAAQVENPTTRAALRGAAVAAVARDPAQWSGYSAKPLRLAPTPDSPLAECLARETAANLDWEIDQQSTDGSWQPNWTWQGQFPAAWEGARREWQGELTLRALRSLRAFGRLEAA